MKKLLLLILTICLSVTAFSSCGDDNGRDIEFSEDVNLPRFEPWLNELSAANVTEVKNVTEYIGIKPGNFKEITSTKDSLAIEEILVACKKIGMREITEEEAQIDGGMGFTVEFVLDDETVRSIYFNNWNYTDGNGNYYTLDSLPRIPSEFDPDLSYSFITLKNSHKVYGADDSEMGELVELGDLEFTEYEGDLFLIGGITQTVTPKSYIETEFGRIYICSEKVFRFADVDMGIERYYELTEGASFKSFIPEK